MTRPSLSTPTIYASGCDVMMGNLRLDEGAQKHLLAVTGDEFKAAYRAGDLAARKVAATKATVLLAARRAAYRWNKAEAVR